MMKVSFEVQILECDYDTGIQLAEELKMIKNPKIDTYPDSPTICVEFNYGSTYFKIIHRNQPPDPEKVVIMKTIDNPSGAMYDTDIDELLQILTDLSELREELADTLDYEVSSMIRSV